MSTILIVEDNEKNMKLVRDLLLHRGHHVIEAPTGLDGVRLARSEAPDLVLMDIQLPDIPGTEALARIRADGASMPVLAISASVMPDEQQRIVASGFDGFIAKPLSMKPFLAAVDAALAAGGAAR